MADTITVRLPCEHGETDPLVDDGVEVRTCYGPEVVARRLWWCEEHNDWFWRDPDIYCQAAERQMPAWRKACKRVEVFMGPIRNG